jgi:hypothetical protein
MTKALCHSERSEESLIKSIYINRFLTLFGMTKALSVIQNGVKHISFAKYKLREESLIKSIFKHRFLNSFGMTKALCHSECSEESLNKSLNK